MNYIINSNSLWREYSNEFFRGWQPVPVATGVPRMQWLGGKISLEVWRTILAFFTEYKANEVQVRLFYNTDTRLWQAHAFPQRYPSGMTTSEIADHANMATDLDLFPHPWTYMGTVHHHCSASAFQSGTDNSNEKEIVGLHITVGDMNSAAHSLHGRVSVKFPGELNEAGDLIRAGSQAFYEADWSNWFELPARVAEVLPAGLHDNILQVLLKTPVGKEVGFPARWSENLIRFRDEPTSFYSHAPGARYWEHNAPRTIGYSNSSAPMAGSAYGAGVHRSASSHRSIREFSHDAPRGAETPAAQTASVQETRKVAPLRTAAESGLPTADHQWLHDSIIALMQPVWDNSLIVGHDIDLEVGFMLLELDSPKMAEDIASKLGFVRSVADTWCLPTEVTEIDRTYKNLQAKMENEERERNFPAII